MNIIMRRNCHHKLKLIPVLIKLYPDEWDYEQIDIIKAADHNKYFFYCAKCVSVFEIQKGRYWKR